MAYPFAALRRTASFIWSHPLGRRQRLRSFARLAAWQLYGRWQRQPRAMPWVNGLVLATTPGMTGATGNLYVGLHEWPDMPFVLHLLRPGDHLLDVGSNVGTYALLAAGGCGAHVTAIEPTKAALTGLRRHIAINHLDHLISVHEVCAGAAPGQVRFSEDLGPMNRVVDHAYGGQSRAVPVIPLDRLHAAGHSCCWKVDVEGLEPEVLAGATHSLRSPILRAVLLEGRQPEVQSTMREHGFEPCRYDPWSRQLFAGQPSTGGNELWIRDLPWVRQRLATAPAFRVCGERI